MNSSTWPIAPSMLARAAIAAMITVVAGCATGAATSIPQTLPAAQAPSPPVVEGQSLARAKYLAPSDVGYDLITADGIHVKTNGQFKTKAERKSAAATIDRYWHDLRECVLNRIALSDQELRDKLLPEFPRHLSIEIANDWRVITGPVTHRRMEAFPSLRKPGAWSTASREEEALYLKVVPELAGLSRQMAGELNLWLGGNTNNLPTELSNVCAGLPCYRFSYNNSPSQAWSNCRD